jgi:hypothetical protein
VGLSRTSTQSPSAWALVNFVKSAIISRLGDVGYRYSIHPAETTSGLVAANLNFGFEPGDIRRYGTNTTPGTTDMAPAIQIAINVALAAQLAGLAGIKVYIPTGFFAVGNKTNHLLENKLTFGGATTAMLPIEIYGDGDSSQVVNNYSIGTFPVFDFTGKNGWKVRDLLLCGNDTNKNDGIWVSTTGGTMTTRWHVERVTTMMAGVGLRLADTNNGTVYKYRAWPNNPPALQVSQGIVTRGNIKEHVLCTGGFVNFVSFRDCETQCSTNFGGSAAFSVNCADASGIFIDGLDVETYDGTQGGGLLFQPSAFGLGCTIKNVYCETSFVQLSNISQSDIGPIMDGEAGGVFQLQSTNRQNAITGVRVATINIIDSQSWGNTFLGCVARTGFSDGSEGANLSNQPNKHFGCLYNGTVVSARGHHWRKLLTYAASMTADANAADHYVIRVTNGTAMAIAISNPTNGKELDLTIRNESGGAMGAITWTGIFQAGWTNPANGFNRTMSIYYDSDFNQWRMKQVTTVDVPN